MHTRLVHLARRELTARCQFVRATEAAGATLRALGGNCAGTAQTPLQVCLIGSKMPCHAALPNKWQHETVATAEICPVSQHAHAASDLLAALDVAAAGYLTGAKHSKVVLQMPNWTSCLHQPSRACSTHAHAQSNQSSLCCTTGLARHTHWSAEAGTPSLQRCLNGGSGVLWLAHQGHISRRQGVRCMAQKAAKARREHCCTECGYATVQYFGVCPNCGEFGTCAFCMCSQNWPTQLKT